MEGVRRGEKKGRKGGIELEFLVFGQAGGLG